MKSLYSKHNIIVERVYCAILSCLTCYLNTCNWQKVRQAIVNGTRCTGGHKQSVPKQFAQPSSRTSHWDACHIWLSSGFFCRVA